ncbi:MAG TPA: hypothetical protein VKX49_12530 [Bryobacteraceae bacterium]|nr:hypothetical protein [Bryobacteraceae bacterium]
MRRLILLALLALPMCATTFPYYHCDAGSANSVTSTAVDTTGATYWVVAVTYYAGVASPPPIVDNKNTNHGQSANTAGSNVGVTFTYWSTLNGDTVGTGHQWSASETGAFMSICVAVYAIANTQTSNDATGRNNTTAGTTLSTNITTATNHDHLTGFCAMGAVGTGGVYSISGASFAKQAEVQYVNGTNIGAVVGTMDDPTSGTVDSMGCGTFASNNSIASYITSMPYTPATNVVANPSVFGIAVQ